MSASLKVTEFESGRYIGMLYLGFIFSLDGTLHRHAIYLGFIFDHALDWESLCDSNCPIAKFYSFSIADRKSVV